MKHLVIFSLGLAILLGASNARADETTTQQLTIPKGKLVLDGMFVFNLSSGAAFKPVSLSPDLWYGATDDLTVGLVHSSAGSGGFIGAPGTSLCLGSKSSGCAGVYNNVGADVRYRLKAPWAIDGGLFLFNIANDAQLALKLGISGRWLFDKLAVELQPNILIYVTSRTDGGTVMGVVTPSATELLSIPVTAGYQVIPKLELGLQTGVSLPFSHPGDTYAIPLSLLGRYAVSPQLSIGLAFTFLQLLGGNGGVDARSLSLGGSYAF